MPPEIEIKAATKEANSGKVFALHLPYMSCRGARLGVFEPLLTKDRYSSSES